MINRYKYLTLLNKTKSELLMRKTNKNFTVRKYLRMRRPSGLAPSTGSLHSESLFEETLKSMSENCSCSNRVKRSSEDKKMRRLQRQAKAQRKRTPRKTRAKTAVSRKQDHCMVDIKMNCFRYLDDGRSIMI